MADVACPVVCQPVWPACWVDTLDWSSSSATRVVQDVWDVFLDELGLELFRLRSFLLFGMLSLGLLLTVFGLFGVVMLRRVYFGPIPELVVPLKLAALPFLVEVCHVFVTGVWEAELLVAVVLVGFFGASQGDEVDVHCAQYSVNSSLSCCTLS